MEVKAIKCPSCGGSLQIPEGKSMFFCTFCGSQIQVDDGKITIDIKQNININQQYTDVAKMRELDLQEQDRIRQEKETLDKKEQCDAEIKRWKKRLLVVHAIFIVVMVIILCSSEKGVQTPAVYFIQMIASIVLAAQRPDHCYLEREPIPKSKFALFGLLWIGGLFAIIMISFFISYPFLNVSR